MADMFEPNGHVNLVLVSHSADLARGLADLVGQIAGPDVRIHTVGGAVDGSLGTNGGQVVVTSGLTGSERIASTNSFTLKAELGKGDGGDED